MPHGLRKPHGSSPEAEPPGERKRLKGIPHKGFETLLGSLQNSHLTKRNS